jgi:hypothetical protein
MIVYFTRPHMRRHREAFDGLSMNRLVIANPSTGSGQAVVKQSMTSEGMDRHGLRPRDDANSTVIARNVVTWQSVCGIRTDTGGFP